MSGTLEDSCLSDVVQPLVKANINLWPERRSLTVSHDKNAPLSEKLVEVKKQCMEILQDYLLAHNSAPDVADVGDDPIQESSEEDEVDVSVQSPRKRK